jgi:hypothetical protein
MAVINEFNDIQFKLAWLKAHPGRTRRDHAAGLKDFDNGEVWKWRREVNAKAMEDERAAWSLDYPEIDYNTVTTCAAAHYPTEYALFVAWSRGRARR